MILHINDKTNSAKPLYYQSLILLFLPCEKFGANDSQNELFVDAYEASGEYVVRIKLRIGNNVSESGACEKVDDNKFSQMKNLIGRTLVKVAVQMFGVTPPWGISTGVKPVKLARIFVEKFGSQNAFDILTQDYLISPSKADMAIKACVYENKLIDNMGDKPCSLYISIPFCPTKCNYCSFVSCVTPRLISLIPDYLNKLHKELSEIADIVKSVNYQIKSIYVGGGTPAILLPNQIDDLMNCVFSNFNTDNCEFTFEAGRPDCITAVKLKVLRDYDVNRISINTQTTNDSVLYGIGRNHTFRDYVNAMETAKNLGFNCINTDLIAGLPGEDVASFKKSVKDVVSFSPENVTIHAFTLKRSSNYRVFGGKGFDVSDIDALEMTDFARSFLSGNEYFPYYVYRQKNTVSNLENVGYSKIGYEGVYNVIMMGEYHTVFGAGAGSVTKLIGKESGCIERVFAPKYPYEYLDETKYAGLDKEYFLRFLKER